MELSYSTDPNWCSKCKHLPCACGAKKKLASAPGKSEFIKLRLEKKRGKAQIIVCETGMNEAQLKELLKQIQAACGTGGCIKDGNLEIQGDHREKIEQILKNRGLKSKRAGG
ncbi:MAG: translation initiation factor [Vulcanimicrobiota bacterium]